MPKTSSSPSEEAVASTSPKHSPSTAITENHSDLESPSEFCLRWNNYQLNLLSVFEQLLEKQLFVDVTLCCEGGYSVKAHKIVLSACSPYFQALFNDTPCDHPIIILKDVQWSDLKSILSFMYKGEIHVSQDQIGPLLKLAELLKIRGLSEEQTDGRELLSHKVNEVPTESKLTKSQMLPKCEVERKKRTAKSYSVDSLSKRIKVEERSGRDDESIGSEENMIDSCQPWLSGTPTSVNEYESDAVKMENNNKNSTITNYMKLKAPTWTPTQLRDAINSVVTQELRFTQASIQYNIPKGTLYDNILGKSNRMQILDEAGLNEEDEMTILEFCCDISTSPYNRRTKKPLSKIMEYMLDSMNLKFPHDTRFGFRWWWAFCKKYSISSLYYGNNNADV
ncbi:protein jim lovell-like [Bradysia coprophila]|uniref:protein jim lovell-like n=1 Tax=Bradysia coprophila TaxID=38358 RepID=UPI00187D8D86|nr:protein jim lovell-like [Bradysia coprophila]